MVVKQACLRNQLVATNVVMLPPPPHPHTHPHTEFKAPAAGGSNETGKGKKGKVMCDTEGKFRAASRVKINTEPDSMASALW